MNAEKRKVYLRYILAAEAVGLLGGLLIRRDVEIYKLMILKPPLSPPAVVFPVAWSILYALMGIGAARVALSPEAPGKRSALRVYWVQLGFNFLWSLIFFKLRAFGFAFFWLAALWALIVWMTLSFRELDRPAARLQIPYLLWVLFAGYLNLGVWKLNG